MPSSICGRPDLDAIASGAWVENLVGVWDGDSIALGDVSLEVIGLVGHTPGSITLVYAARRRAHPPVHRRQPVPGRTGQDLGGRGLRYR